MSFTYTDYHHHQFDRQFSLPLPMPSPTSCWYPQRQDVQFGYFYPDMAAVSNLETRLDNTDRFVEVLRPPPRPQPDPDPSYYQRHYSDAAMNTHLSGGYCQQPHYLNPNITGQPLNPYYWPEVYQKQAVDQLPAQPPYMGLNLPKTPPYPGTEPLSMPRDLVTLDSEPNLSMADLVSQIERLTADVEQLVSQMDAHERRLSDPHAAMRPPPAPAFSVHQPLCSAPHYSAAPYTVQLHINTDIAGSLQQPPTQHSPPCSHDIRYGSIESLADDIDAHESVQSRQIHYDDILSDQLLINQDPIGDVEAQDVIHSSVEGSFTVSNVEASKEINVKFGESVIGRNELDNKWILEEGLDVSVEVSKVPNVEESEIKDDWQAINVKQPKWTNLGGRSSVPVIISGSSIAISLRQRAENEVPSTWDPGVLFNSSYSLLVAENNRDGEAAQIYFFEFISKVYIGMLDPIFRGNYEKYCHSNCRQGFQVEIALPKFLLNISDGVSGRILKVTREMESLTPDWQRGYKQAWHDSSAQDRRTEFLSEVADFPSQVVAAEKAMEPIPSQTADVSCADVSCATEEQDDVVSTLKRKNQPFYTTSDAAAPPLHERDRRLGVFAEMESHLAITDRRVDSLLLPDLPEPDPPNTPPVWQQPTSGPLSGFNLPPQAQPPPVVQPLPLGSQSLHQPVTHLLGSPPWETLMFSLPVAPQPLHNLPGQCIQLILSSCDQQAPLRRSPSCRDTLNHHCSAAPLPDAAQPPAANDSQHNGTMDEGVIDRLKVTHIVNEVKRLLIRYAFDPGGSVSQNFARDRKKIEAYVQWVLKQVKIIGVEPFNAIVMLSSLHLDRVELNQAGGFVAKGAVMELDEEIHHLWSKELTEGMCLVSHNTCASIKNMFEEIWSILKLPLVGAETYGVYYGLKGANGVAIISGADLNFSALRLMIAAADVVALYWQLTSMGIELLGVFHGSQISELDRLLASWFPP